MLEPADITSAALIICFEKNTYEKLQKEYKGSNLINIQMLGYYHPRGPLDIPDPINFSDPNGYDKCFSMCQKSIEHLVKLLEEEEEAEAKKKPKIIKLPDPTIFTITSPSAWQKNKLKSPDICLPEVSEPVEPWQTTPVELPSCQPSPPQELPPDIPDIVNLPQIMEKMCYEAVFDNENMLLSIVPIIGPNDHITKTVCSSTCRD